MPALTLGLSYRRAVRARKLSVVLNVIGFYFFVTDQILICALIKILAEGMRIPYFEHTGARDMTFLCLFFVTGSILAVYLRLS